MGRGFAFGRVFLVLGVFWGRVWFLFRVGIVRGRWVGWVAKRFVVLRSRISM